VAFQVHACSLGVPDGFALVRWASGDRQQFAAVRRCPATSIACVTISLSARGRLGSLLGRELLAEGGGVGGAGSSSSLQPATAISSASASRAAPVRTGELAHRPFQVGAFRSQRLHGRAVGRTGTLQYRRDCRGGAGPRARAMAGEQGTVRSAPRPGRAGSEERTATTAAECLPVQPGMTCKCDPAASARCSAASREAGAPAGSSLPSAALRAGGAAAPAPPAANPLGCARRPGRVRPGHDLLRSASRSRPSGPRHLQQHPEVTLLTPRARC